MNFSYKKDIKEIVRGVSPRRSPKRSTIEVHVGVPDNSFSEYILDRDKRGARINLNPYVISEIPFKERKSIAFLLKLKQKFVNSRIYDYSSKELSSRIGVSIYNVEKHMTYLMNNGYVKIDGNDILLLSLDETISTYRKKKWSIFVRDGHSINEIASLLSFLILRENIKHQEYIRSVKRNDLVASGVLIDPKFSNSDYKKVRDVRKYAPEKLHGAYVGYNIVSVRQISSLLGCSSNKASFFLKEIVDLKLCRTSEIKEFVKYFNGRWFGSEEYKKDNGITIGYFFVHNGRVLKHSGTRIDLI